MEKEIKEEKEPCYDCEEKDNEIQRLKDILDEISYDAAQAIK